LSYNGQNFEFTAKKTQDGDQEQSYDLDQTGKLCNPPSRVHLQYGIKYYRFKPGGTTTTQAIGVLQPPFGVNLTSILYTNKGLRSRVNDLFRSRNFRLEIRPVENEMRIAKVMDDELYSFPYDWMSPTNFS
jgi:hypothetical protein